jgi:diguanylate cyclase (GGDEF)-like protein
LSAAEKISASIRTNDALGRIGGDEFLVVCPDIPSHDVAVEVAQRVSEAMRGSLETARGGVELGASLGVAWTNDPGLSPDALIAQADTAMYESKVCGAGTVVLAPDLSTG